VSRGKFYGNRRALHHRLGGLFSVLRRNQYVLHHYRYVLLEAVSLCAPACKGDLKAASTLK
jgi:hypothetical protein